MSHAEGSPTVHTFRLQKLVRSYGLAAPEQPYTYGFRFALCSLLLRRAAALLPAPAPACRGLLASHPFRSAGHSFGPQATAQQPPRHHDDALPGARSPPRTHPRTRTAPLAASWPAPSPSCHPPPAAAVHRAPAR